MTFKKTSIISSLMLSSALILGACQSDGESTVDTTNNDTSNDIEDNQTGENPATTPGQEYEFTKFEMEVDYQDQEEALDVKYEEHKDATEAEYKSVAEDLDVKSDDAMAQLRPLLNGMELKVDMTDEEIMKRIIEAFSIEDNYKEIEADITFANKEKRKIHATQ